MTYNLEQLLSAPLPEIADDGFSAKVMMRVHQRQKDYVLLQTVALGVLALLVAALLPWQIILDLLLPLLLNTGNLFAFGLAGAAMALTFCLERQISQS